MSHSYVQNVVHIVFSTKDRRRLITAELKPRLWAYVYGVCKDAGIRVHAIGGTSDHIHVLIQIPAHLPTAKIVNLIKVNSSRWVTKQGARFSWQEGYALFSVSSSVVPRVVRYIHEQEVHHRSRTFDEEFLALLKKHGVPFDPQYVFG
jgi:putative transposase